jgi:hypothetical protein
MCGRITDKSWGDKFLLVPEVALFLRLNFGHGYGLVENLLFREAGEYFPGHHFRFYPWHARSNWDNYFGLPLVLGCYAWWWILAAASLVFLVTSFC